MPGILFGKFNATLLIALAAMLLAASACSGNRAPKSNGGGVVDGGGGGDFVLNTRDEVLSSLNSVWSKIVTQDKANPIFRAHELTHFVSDPSTRKVELILRQILTGKEPLPKSRVIFYETFQKADLQYFMAKQLKLEETALCKGPFHKGYLASVTKLDRGGEICVSVKGLMGSPSGALTGDLVALLIHELAHLNGFDEDDALLVQKFVLTNIRKIMRTSFESVRTDNLNLFEREILAAAGVLVTFDVIDLEYLGRVKELLRRIDTFRIQRLPPPTMDDKDLEVARVDLYPELISLFSYAKWPIEKLGFELGDRLKQNPEAKLNAEDLKSIRSIVLRIVEIHDKLYLYYENLNGDFISKNESEYLLKLTAPETLTDPNARPQRPPFQYFCHEVEYKHPFQKARPALTSLDPDGCS